MSRRFTGDKLVIASHNRGKLEEFSALLAPLNVTCVSAADLGLPEPEETEDSFIGNARIKAKAAALASGLPALADDSGLTIDALDGAPGVYTADWAYTPNGRDFGMAMENTWAKLEEANAPLPRLAQFRCTLLLYWPDGHEEIFEGVAPGELIWPRRGAEGHGYDPMFQPEGLSQTFAELSHDEKNAISHRGKAVDAMLKACFT
ncbi:RdgB/HAM1 family non-canonical purine NTP pyrophosphatase [Xinfangfangia sp. CPCC 101601]|uniref:dITP/XTP pyrophosphatase n=1 Tax=Pseudogemmobacter lacusdianii TaxID=3069608 RepID=A0ABU0VTW6_9RHOB|nr:RdgB/HAM1 family non-canonical purine NTP pyrophosphatase [Xinfangfangia sp. CPCC 101601]MDQ2065174.1 RdgB/HAM1 family non-canonical purine NTP pyrophosphatase [Xinfangfangia sp. CPCC 101601]